MLEKRNNARDELLCSLRADVLASHMRLESCRSHESLPLRPMRPALRTVKFKHCDVCNFVAQHFAEQSVFRLEAQIQANQSALRITPSKRHAQPGAKLNDDSILQSR